MQHIFVALLFEAFFFKGHNMRIYLDSLSLAIFEMFHQIGLAICPQARYFTGLIHCMLPVYFYLVSLFSVIKLTEYTRGNFVGYFLGIKFIKLMAIITNIHHFYLLFENVLFN